MKSFMTIHEVQDIYKGRSLISESGKIILYETNKIDFLL